MLAGSARESWMHSPSNSPRTQPPLNGSKSLRAGSENVTGSFLEPRWAVVGAMPPCTVSTHAKPLRCRSAWPQQLPVTGSSRVNYLCIPQVWVSFPLLSCALVLVLRNVCETFARFLSRSSLYPSLSEHAGPWDLLSYLHVFTVLI